MTQADATCCRPFDPGPWDETEVAWQNKPFVKTRVRCLFHIPLNFPSVMKKQVELIEAAGAKPAEMIVLADENSLWGVDVYLSVTQPVPGAQMATISGTFLAKVFEGPFRRIGTWIKNMGRYVEAKGKQIKKLYFYYTTCPRCAKKYGKNYVVLLAQV